MTMIIGTNSSTGKSMVNVRPIAVKMGFRNQELMAILIMLASPSTVTCFVMAKGMDNDEVLSSSIVVLTTLLSSVTLTAWIFILRNFGLI